MTRRPPAVRSRNPERDRLIVRLRADGWTLVEIARNFGLSKQRVHQIVVRADGVR